MRRTRRLHSVAQESAAPVNINAGQSRSVVGSDNDLIARATSILIGFVSDPRNLTPSQAADVVHWYGSR
jgi:hypothetical protein